MSVAPFTGIGTNCDPWVLKTPSLRGEFSDNPEHNARGNRMRAL